jgi:transcriptional regulator with XRE-family HTH domain
VTRDEEVVAEVGRRLRAVRVQRGWSLDAVGERSGLVSGAAVGSYERGVREPKVSVLVHLAGVYGVPPAVLLPGMPLLDPVQMEATVQAVRSEADRMAAAVAVAWEVAGHPEVDQPLAT